MIRFKTLSIQNFLSYGAAPTVINLDPGGTTLIVGEDLDNTAAGTGANGVGKTVWLNALVFALYGKPVSNISMDNLVNNINNTHLEVIVEFQKDDMLYVVKRVRKEKGLGNYARVYKRPVGVELDMRVHKDNEQDVTPDSVKHINDYIADALDIPHELFVRIVAFSATHTPFLDLPVRHASQANQSDIMEELFRLNRLSEKALLLKAAMKDTKTSLEIKQKHNEQLEKEHARHEELLATAKQRVDAWVVSNDIEIGEAKEKLKTFEQYDIEAQESLFDAVKTQTEIVTSIREVLVEITTKNNGFGVEYEASDKELMMLKEQLNGMQGKVDKWNDAHSANIQAHEEAKNDLVDDAILISQRSFRASLEEYNIKKSDIDKQIKAKEDDIISIIKKIDEVKEEIKHLEDSNCPYCLQKYESAESKIKERAATLKVYDDTKKSHNYDLRELIKKNGGCVSDLETITSSITHTISEIDIEEKLRVDLFKKIDELKITKNPFNMDDAQKYESRIIELDDAMKKLEDEVTRISFDIDVSNKNLVVEQDELTKIVKQIKFKSLEELWEVKGNKSRVEEKLEELKVVVNPHEESYDELKNTKLEPIDMETINQLDKLLTHQTYLQKLLTKKDSFIRKNLLNKNLIFLNQRLRGYLSDLGLPHRVEFTQEMTAHISQFGRQLDFGNLSSGQKARVNLALSFSFRDVLQRSLDSVNVCMLDEVLDVGLDSVGVQNAAHMLKRKAREDELTLFIISHRDEVSGIFDKTLTVTMEKGFSSISQAA